MKKISINLLLICCLTKLVSTEINKEKWYKTANNKMYYIEENYEFSWYEAYLQCSLKRLSLLTLETMEEHDDLAQVLKTENFIHHAPHLWIGAVGANRQFAWVANSQPVFTNKWIGGNPDNYNQEENCLHIWENTTKFNDRKCSYKYGFICEENSSLSDEEKYPGKYRSITLNIVNSSQK